MVSFCRLYSSCYMQAFIKVSIRNSTQTLAFYDLGGTVSSIHRITGSILGKELLEWGNKLFPDVWHSYKRFKSAWVKLGGVICLLDSEWLVNAKQIEKKNEITLYWNRIKLKAWISCIIQVILGRWLFVFIYYWFNERCLIKSGFLP